MQLNNRKALKQRRRELRNNPTPAERKLWEWLRKSSIDGYKFRRQHSVGPFILDFYCPSARLAIEVDGGVHSSLETLDYDKQRMLYLNSVGVKVLRFRNREVMKDIAGVLKTIRMELSSWTTTPLPPSATRI